MSKLLDRFRYFKQKGDTFADGHGQVMYTNAIGKTVIASAGSLIRSCAQPTASTARAPVAGKFMSKTVW